MSAVTATVMCESAGGFRREAVELAAPGRGEVLVRIVGAGLSQMASAASEQRPLAHLPAMYGYEGAGIVEQVGSGVRKVQPGDAVVTTFASCGQCANCQRARYSYCSRRLEWNAPRARHGLAPASALFSFASHILASERSVVRIPADAPVELMGPLGGGIQAGAGAVINVLRPAPGSSIAIFGVGAVGMAALLAAKALGCGIIVAVDRHQERLALAQRLGATHALHSERQDLAHRIGGFADDGVQSAVECTGDPGMLRQAVAALRATGTCAMLGKPASEVEVSLPMEFMLAGRTLRGVLEGDAIPDLFVPELIELWRQGRFPFDKLVRFYDLADLPKAIDAVRRGTVLKPIVRPAPW